MRTKEIQENCPIQSEERLDDFKALLAYIDNLAKHKLGYPVSLLTYIGLIDNRVLGIQPNSLANVLLNNVGDPFKDSETSLMEVKKHEREIIRILEHYYGLAPGAARGYVTTGGTEGNFASLWWSKRYLVSKAIDKLIQVDDLTKQQIKEEQELTAALGKISNLDYQTRMAQLEKILAVRNAIVESKGLSQQLLTPTIFFTKNHTHYSVPKISEILHLNVRPVMSNPDGSMNLDNLRKELLLHMGAHPHSSVIVIANIGTTITGAIDDIPGIKKIIEELPTVPTYTIHMDGALSGFVLPILKPFGDIPDYFGALGVNTLAVSAHKYPGLSQPCGIILAKKEFFEKAFDKSERSIDYVGNISDVTITGSRSGLNVLMFYHALATLGLDKGVDKLKKLVDDNLKIARYLYNRLINVYGADKVSYLYHFNVTFPKTSSALAKKYQLMITGETATICVLSNVTKNLIDDFIQDLVLECTENNNQKENDMDKTQAKAKYKTLTLGREHMQSLADLFTKTFCDYEPITKHLDIEYHEYEPFVMDVIQKAVKDGLSVVAVDDNNKVIACTIAEDISNPLTPNLSAYPKLKPIYALLDELSKPFMANKTFTKSKIAHVWIAIVDPAYQGKGLSTVIDLACGKLLISKGYDYAYAEFTNPVSEKITHHYDSSKLLNSISYNDFKWGGTMPFKGVTGEAKAYIVSIRPGVTVDSLEKCYTIRK